MKVTRQVTGLLVVALGIFLAWQGTRLRIDGDFGPGPGFFPFWIGLGLVAMGAAWSLRLAFGGADAVGEEGFLPPRENLVLLVVVVGALVAFMLLLRPIGFDLAMLALLLALFFAIDRSRVVAKLATAIVASFGVHWVFETLLAMPLPHAAIPALRQFGF